MILDHQACIKLAGLQVDHFKVEAVNVSSTAGNHGGREFGAVPEMITPGLLHYIGYEPRR